MKELDKILSDIAARIDASDNDANRERLKEHYRTLLDPLINQEVEKRIAETVAGKFIAVEIEKRIADRFPSKEKILKYFNNHFNCHADVIIGDYETTEVAMTDSAVLKMFEWLRNQITEKK